MHHWEKRNTEGPRSGAMCPEAKLLACPHIKGLACIMTAFMGSQEVRNGTDPGFTIKVRTFGEIMVTSRSGCYANVFIVFAESMEAELDFRQGCVDGSPEFSARLRLDTG